MFKRTFTLVEMLVVVLVISLLLWLVLFSWWKNVTEIQFRSDKETFLSLINKIRTNALSSNYYKDVKYDYLEVEYDRKKNILKTLYISGWTHTDLDITYLPNSYFSGNNWFKLTYSPYSVDCSFTSLDSIVNINWNNTIELLSKSRKYSYCFDISISACRIKEVQCLDNK